MKGANMPIATTPLSISARDFTRDVSKAKQETAHGPVIITDRGAPSHVLLSYKEYCALAERRVSLFDAVAAPSTADFEFTPPRLTDGFTREVDLS